MVPSPGVGGSSSTKAASSSTKAASGANAPAPIAKQGHLTVGQLDQAVKGAGAIMQVCLDIAQGSSQKQFNKDDNADPDQYLAFKTALFQDPDTSYATPDASVTGGGPITMRALAGQIIQASWRIERVRLRSAG